VFARKERREGVLSRDLAPIEGKRINEKVVQDHAGAKDKKGHHPKRKRVKIVLNLVKRKRFRVASRKGNERAKGKLRAGKLGRRAAGRWGLLRPTGMGCRKKLADAELQ